MTETPTYGPISPDTPPPFEVLEQLRQALVIIDEVGPQYLTGKALERLEDGLFDGARRRSTAKGRAIKWVKGPPCCRDEILSKIPVGDQHANAVYAALTRLSQERKELICSVYLEKPLSNDQMIDQHLIFIRTKNSYENINGILTHHEYAKVSEPWARFFVELESLEETITGLLLRCLKDGRVICVTDFQSQFQIITPDNWSARSSLSAGALGYFLLTSDLPEDWSLADLGSSVRADRRRKAAAKRWLYGEYVRLERLGEHMTKAEVDNHLKARFEMTTPAVMKEVWSETPISNWRKPGRRKNPPRK